MTDLLTWWLLIGLLIQAINLSLMGRGVLNGTTSMAVIIIVGSMICWPLFLAGVASEVMKSRRK